MVATFLLGWLGLSGCTTCVGTKDFLDLNLRLECKIWYPGGIYLPCEAGFEPEVKFHLVVEVKKDGETITSTKYENIAWTTEGEASVMDLSWPATMDHVEGADGVFYLLETEYEGATEQYWVNEDYSRERSDEETRGDPFSLELSKEKASCNDYSVDGVAAWVL